MMSVSGTVHNGPSRLVVGYAVAAAVSLAGYAVLVTVLVRTGRIESSPALVVYPAVAAAAMLVMGAVVARTGSVAAAVAPIGLFWVVTAAAFVVTRWLLSLFESMFGGVVA